jgi:hypothetical protein
MKLKNGLKNVADAWHLIEKEGLLAVKYGYEDRHCAT